MQKTVTVTAGGEGLGPQDELSGGDEDREERAALPATGQGGGAHPGGAEEAGQARQPQPRAHPRQLQVPRPRLHRL